MADFITSAAKIVFPEKFKQSLQIEGGSPDQIGPRSLLNLFEFDIVKTREAVYENEITENPVEDGTKITDHIIKKPIEINFDGLITEASIGNSILSGITRSLPFGSTLERKSLTEAYKVLEGLRTNLTEIIIETPKGGFFRKMYVKSLRMLDDKDTSTTLKFNISFRQLSIAFSDIQTVKINRIDSAKPISSKGEQAAQASETKTEEIDLLRFIGNRFENRSGNYTPIQ